MANLKLQIGLLEAKIGKKSNMKSIDKRVKARVKGAKKEYLSLQLQVLIKEKLARKLVIWRALIIFLVLMGLGVYH